MNPKHMTRKSPQCFLAEGWGRMLLLLSVVVSFAAAAFESSSGAFIFQDQKGTLSLMITKGHYTLIPRQGYQTIHNASGKIVQITDEGKNLRLLGRNWGDVSLSTGSHFMNIIVTSENQKEGGQKMAQALSSRQGLLFEPHHPCHLIKGELLRWEDWQKIQEIATTSLTCYQFQALIADEIKPQVEKEMQNLLNNPLWGKPIFTNGLPLALAFPESARDHLSFIEKILSGWGIKPIFSTHIIDMKPMIRTQIVVAEINQNRIQTLGIHWPGNYQAQVLPFRGFEKNWEVELQALEGAGQGKVLAHPSLLSRSGESAEFLAGGEIPFRLTQKKTHEISWKKYGISLTIIPKTDSRGYLKVDLTAEVSNPDSSLSDEGLPAFKTHRVQTHFNLSSSQTIAISGLLRDETNKSRKGLPFLEKIPLLGYLFSQHENQDHHSELLILVTPTVIDEESEPLSLPKENPELETNF